ncbi:hypothetical protein DFA_03692 [Cavenderia fasciculata]|uniref:RRM domain-containing protein n=1 Tax=Cavenderia fasciculata TaxID=261658 RepID=F4Q1Q5_CACFS|nr:uncharacterized protein DFA_03692 [Cavenderia fasciculata]EGG18205.1 hypothetical protein DFA_03692 [Cavenderia fasciculata]|eukprot:XP_004357028.1 hypothetical protein DFA_03692 [Cavenderia fasciculata]
MGIPAFYRWLVDKYPKSIQYFQQQQQVEEQQEQDEVSSSSTTTTPLKIDPRCNNVKFNNLYIDMNGVIHNSTHAKGEPSVESIMASKPNTDDTIKENIFKRLNDIIVTTNPSDLVYIALDGVPPRAKATEQRRRRFRSAKDIREILSKGPKQPNPRHNNNNNHSSSSPSTSSPSTSSPPITTDESSDPSTPSTPAAATTPAVAQPNYLELLDKVFDSNSISPATEFMNKVNHWIGEYISTVLAKSHPHLAVVLSDTTVPGEGEHKIMDFIRGNHKNWSESTSHIFYGMDADLIFLGLSVHLQRFFVLRDFQSLSYGCSICKSEYHMSYECKSALAMKKLHASNKEGDIDWQSNGINTTKISVRNIPSQASEADIREIFSYYGEIVDIKFEKAPTKKPSLTAFIQFGSVDAVKDIACRGAYFYVNNIKLTIAQYYKDEKVEVESPLIEEQAENAVVEEDDGVYYNNSIFCTRLELDVTEKDVVDFFKPTGKVESVQFLTTPRRKAHPFKFCIINFGNLDDVKKSLTMDGKYLKGNKVTLKKSRPPAQKEPVVPEEPKPKVVISEEEKAEKEAEKEKRRIEKEEKANQFITIAGHGMNLDSSYFYLGLAEWDFERANELFIKFGRALSKQEDEYLTVERKFEFVNLDNLRQYIKYYLTFGLENESQLDINNCINDITVMCMLMGNDFLPHLPAVSIKDGSIELILGWYKDWIHNSIKSTGKVNYLTVDTNIIYSNFSELLNVLGNWESVIYPDKLERMGKKDLARLTHILKVSKEREDKEKEEAEANGRMASEFEEERNDILTSQLANLQEGELNYYKLKLQASTSEVENVKQWVCQSYVRGLSWVLKYYTVGCPDWKWSYNFHYAPLAADLAAYCKEMVVGKGFKDTSHIEFKLGAPLQPLAHLLSVLPVYSGKFLPAPLADLMKSKQLSTFYRERYRIDLNGEEVSWKGVVLVNFIDVSALESLANPIAEQLSKNDPHIAQLNKLGNDIYYLQGDAQSSPDSYKIFLDQQKKEEEESSHTNQSINNSSTASSGLNEKDFKWATRYLITLSPQDSDLYNSLD